MFDPDGNATRMRVLHPRGLRLLSIIEQVRRGLIFFWMKQPLPDGIIALNFMLDDFQPEDGEFGLVEGKPDAGAGN